MKKVIITAFTALVVCVSCSIEMNMHIKADNTGNAEMKVDISQMMSFMMSLDSISDEERDSMLLEAMDMDEEFAAEDIAKMEAHGLTNFSMGIEEESFMVIRYDFAKLNDSYDFFYLMDTSVTEEERNEMLATDAFLVEDDKTTILFQDDGLSAMLMTGMAEEGEDGMDMSFMTSLFTFKQTYKFDRKVVAIDAGDLPVRLKNNEVYYSTNLAEYLENFIGQEIVVWFAEPSKGKKKKKK